MAVLAMLLPAAMALDARKLMEEVERRQQFNSLQQNATLSVTEPDGHLSTKRWEVISSGSKDNRKARIRFTFPPDVRGVGLLILNRPKGPALQWMWVPSLGRDRRIAPQDRGMYVFGADLTFEDL